MQCVHLIDLHPEYGMSDHIGNIGSEESIDDESRCAGETEQCK